MVFMLLTHESMYLFSFQSNKSIILIIESLPTSY